MKFFATHSEYLCETNLGYDLQVEKQWCQLTTYIIQGVFLLGYPPLIRRHRCCVATDEVVRPAVLSPAQTRVKESLCIIDNEYLVRALKCFIISLRCRKLGDSFKIC